MWQCFECQQVVDSRPVVQQRRKLSNRTPSVIVEHRRGRHALNVDDIFQRDLLLLIVRAISFYVVRIQQRHGRTDRRTTDVKTHGQTERRYAIPIPRFALKCIAR